MMLQLRAVHLYPVNKRFTGLFYSA